MSDTSLKNESEVPNHHGGQVIHKIVLIEYNVPQDHGELMSLLTCQMQNNMSMSIPPVHTNSYGNNSFSNQHNRDPMQMQQFGQCDYIPNQQSMFPAINSFHCMPHIAQYRPHNLICMCGQSHCTITAASSNHHYGNSYLCNEPTVHN